MAYIAKARANRLRALEALEGKPNNIFADADRPRRVERPAPLS